MCAGGRDFPRDNQKTKFKSGKEIKKTEKTRVKLTGNFTGDRGQT